jgi:histidinol dehydrogenase
VPLELNSRAHNFDIAFAHFLSEKRETAVDVATTVAGILRDVQENGDEAVLKYTNKFDRTTYNAGDLVISAAEIDAALAECPADQIEALKVAADRITAYHQRQVPSDERFTDEAGVELGHRWTAIASVGLYVPGGLAAYPSSLLMNAIPAKVAGVERLAMCVPTPDNHINPLVLAAARVAGVSEIYRVGGAQAIAALTYGTNTIAPVDKIVGPGNAFVSTAKRQVFGIVGIDMTASPSEILVVSDGKSNPDWIAADLLSQAEHDAVAQSILITDDAAFADQVKASVERQLTELPKQDIATASWQDYGAIILVQDLEQDAPALVDKIAPEHLEISLDDPEVILAKVRNAGTIFLGRHTPEAIGDYVAGTNHVLPTSRSARFFSGLNTGEFLKRTSIVKCSEQALLEIGPYAVTLAEAEGLSAHARSVSKRIEMSDS